MGPDILMKIWINGNDESDTLGKDLTEKAATLAHEAYANLSQGASEILSLRSAESNAEYLDRYVNVVRKRGGVDPALYSQPRTPSLKGTISYTIRMFLWRILRYQHFWMAFHQNDINAMHAKVLDFEHQEHNRQISELEGRMKQLEAQIKTLQERAN